MQPGQDRLLRFKPVQRIFAWWEWISELGVPPEARGSTRKREILLNRAAAVAALYDLVFASLVLGILVVISAFRGELFFLWTVLKLTVCFWVVGFLHLAILWLRYKKIPAFTSTDRSNAIEYFGYTITIILILVTGLIFPFSSLYFLFAMALVSLIPVVRNRRRYDTFVKFALFLFSMGVFLFLIYWYNSHPAAHNVPPWISAVLQWIMPPGAFGLIFMIGSYIASESEKSETALDAEREKTAALHQESERLLLNILPAQISEELKANGRTTPREYASATVLFTDFVGFTRIAENLSPTELVGELDRCFSYFDSVAEKYGLEKLKTIGDAYMAAGGIPIANTTHPFDCALAAIEIQSFMNQMKVIKTEQNLPYWELRLGMHTGPLVAGVVGDKKFAYDVWGDTVNTASRMESSGEAGAINISRELYNEIKFLFECEYRGKVHAKNKGDIEMYFLRGLKPKYSVSGLGRVPNGDFKDLYARLKGGAKLVAK